MGFLDGQVGLIQRVFAATVLAWLFMLSLRLFRLSTAGRSRAFARGPAQLNNDSLELGWGLMRTTTWP